MCYCLIRWRHPLRLAIWAPLLLAVLLVPSAQTGAAEKSTPTEYQVKAAFLFNFAKFVEWPPRKLGQAEVPLVIGVLGEDPFGENLDRVVHNKTINDHPLALRRFKGGDDLKECHLLFVSRSENERVEEIAAAVRDSGVLLVSESEKFLERGGMINFVLESATVKFSINVQAAERAGLKISSKLLNVAKATKNESN